MASSFAVLAEMAALSAAAAASWAVLGAGEPTALEEAADDAGVPNAPGTSAAVESTANAENTITAINEIAKSCFTRLPVAI